MIAMTKHRGFIRRPPKYVMEKTTIAIFLSTKMTPTLSLPAGLRTKTKTQVALTLASSTSMIVAALLDLCVRQGTATMTILKSMVLIQMEMAFLSAKKIVMT